MFKVLAIFFILRITLNCKTKINDYYERYFYVASTTQDCTNFTFIKCQFTYCSDQKIYADGDKKCLNQITERYTQWDKCLSILCQMSDKPQNYQTLQECYAKNRKSHLLELSLGIGLGLLSVVGLPLIIFLCYRDNRCCEILEKIAVWSKFKRYWLKKQKQVNQQKTSIHQEQNVQVNDIVSMIQNDCALKIKICEDQTCVLPFSNIIFDKNQNQFYNISNISTESS